MDFFNFVRAIFIAAWASVLAGAAVFFFGLLAISAMHVAPRNTGWFVGILFIIAATVFWQVLIRVRTRLLRNVEMQARAADEARWQHEQEWRRSHRF